MARTAIVSLVVVWGMLVMQGTLRAQTTEMAIGVLAYRGDQEAIKRWTSTADYLSLEIPGYRFRIVPLSLKGMREAAVIEELDFFLTNPGHYVELESTYGATRLVTLKNLRQGKPYTVFGSVIFTRSNRNDILRISDLRDKSFMAVSRDSFGGFQLAWRELQVEDLNPFKDFSRLVFNGFPQDDIVYAVRDGLVDAGTVRTEILERMSAEGKINLDDYRILKPHSAAGYPFSHSTRLYPEWPFAKAYNTTEDLGQRVAIALLTMPGDHPAVLQGQYAGWTVPHDYYTVHELLRELGIGPYRSELTLDAILRAYWHWLVLGSAVIMLMALVMIYVLNLNHKLKQSKMVLQKEFNVRRRTAAEMRKLSSALEQTADIVMITNRVGTIEYVNPAFENVTLYSRDETLGTRPDIVKSGVHDRAFYENMWKIILNGGVYRDLFVNRRKDGELFYEEKTITPLKDANGKILHFIATGKDVTESKLAEERDRQHRAELAHVSRVSTMGEMASSIAHELNQPLSAIANYAQGCVRRMDQKQYDSGKIITALTQITKQSERSGEIIRRLREFVRKGEPRRIRTNINNIVRGAAELANLEARTRGVHLRLSLREGLPDIYADSIQIEQVILNLTRNSIEAMDEIDSQQRDLMIHTWASSDNRVHVAVRDSGPGIMKSDWERIFDAFFSTKPDGMGMGLSISRSIIEAHGGNLAVVGNGSRGTTIRFSLPVANQEPGP